MEASFQFFHASLSRQTYFPLDLVPEDDPAFQQSMVEGGGAQRAVVDLLVEQVKPMLCDS